MTDRTAALAMLAAQAGASEGDTPNVVALTGTKVYAGGDTPRVLVGEARLTYRQGKYIRTANAVVGDLVLLTEAQAARLDRLGATTAPAVVEVPTEATEVAATEAGDNAEDDLVGTMTVDDVKALGADDLVAYVKANPDVAHIVRALEEARPQGPRVTVIRALDALEDNGA